MPLDQLRDDLEAVIRQRLDKVKIVRVEVREGDDHDGDAALFVDIVFEGSIDSFPMDRLVGITRHMRSSLERRGETRFPYTRFISREDYEEAAA